MRMLLRKLITSEGVVIGMLDSSPQGYRDLLMHEISYVFGEDLPVVGRVLDTLHALIGTENTEDKVDEIRRLTKSLHH